MLPPPSPLVARKRKCQLQQPRLHLLLKPSRKLLPAPLQLPQQPRPTLHLLPLALPPVLLRQPLKPPTRPPMLHPQRLTLLLPLPPSRSLELTLLRAVSEKPPSGGFFFRSPAWMNTAFMPLRGSVHAKWNQPLGLHQPLVGAIQRLRANNPMKARPSASANQPAGAAWAWADQRPE